MSPQMFSDNDCILNWDNELYGIVLQDLKTISSSTKSRLKLAKISTQHLEIISSNVLGSADPTHTLILYQFLMKNEQRITEDLAQIDSPNSEILAPGHRKQKEFISHMIDAIMSIPNFKETVKKYLTYVDFFFDDADRQKIENYLANFYIDVDSDLIQFVVESQKNALIRWLALELFTQVHDKETSMKIDEPEVDDDEVTTTIIHSRENGLISVNIRQGDEKETGGKQVQYKTDGGNRSGVELKIEASTHRKEKRKKHMEPSRVRHSSFGIFPNYDDIANRVQAESKDSANGASVEPTTTSPLFRSKCISSTPRPRPSGEH